MNNKKLGNDFEKELCSKLRACGFWAYNCPPTHAGQPIDIIACIKDRPILIDCKVCSNDKFRLSRVEENQNLSMRFFKKCGNYSTYFAFKFLEDNNNEIYFLHFSEIQKALENGSSSLTKQDIKFYGLEFKSWKYLYL